MYASTISSNLGIVFFIDSAKSSIVFSHLLGYSFSIAIHIILVFYTTACTLAAQYFCEKIVAATIYNRLMLVSSTHIHKYMLCARLNLTLYYRLLSSAHGCSTKHVLHHANIFCKYFSPSATFECCYFCNFII